MYSNNPAYKLELSHGNVRLFSPVNIMDGYHTQRYLEAQNQLIYNSGGANRDVLETVMNEIINRCNDEKNRNIRTEIGNLAESIRYRLKYPVDEHCSIRLGAILSFMEEDVDGITHHEQPDKQDFVWLDKKMKLAFSDSKLYTFFLTTGIVNTPEYSNHLDTLKDTEYFVKRFQTIQSLTSSLISPSKS